MGELVSVGLALGVGDCEPVGSADGVDVGVRVGICDDDCVSVGLPLGLGVCTLVGDWVAVVDGVTVTETLCEGVGVGVAECRDRRRSALLFLHSKGKGQVRR